MNNPQSTREAFERINGLLFDDGTDATNRVCSRIALAMLAGILAIWIVTEIWR